MLKGNKFDWAIKMFVAEFGVANVFYDYFDYGHSFGIGAQKGDNRLAVKLAFSFKDYKTTLLNKKSKYKYWQHFDINKFKDKKKRLRFLISRIKNVLNRNDRNLVFKDVSKDRKPASKN